MLSMMLSKYSVHVYDIHVQRIFIPLSLIFKCFDHIVTASEVSDLLKERKIESLESEINSTAGFKVAKIL